MNSLRRTDANTSIHQYYQQYQLHQTAETPIEQFVIFHFRPPFCWMFAPFSCRPDGWFLKGVLSHVKCF